MTCAPHSPADAKADAARGRGDRLGPHTDAAGASRSASDSVDSLAAAATSSSSSGSATELQESGGLPGAGEEAAEASEPPWPEGADSRAEAAADGLRQIAELHERLGSLRPRCAQEAGRLEDAFAEVRRGLVNLGRVLASGPAPNLEWAHLPPRARSPTAVDEGGASEGLRKQLEEQLGAGLRMNGEVAAELADLRPEVLSSHQERLQPKGQKEQAGAFAQRGQTARLPEELLAARQGGRRESLVEQPDPARGRELDAAKTSEEEHAHRAADQPSAMPGSPSACSQAGSDETDEDACLRRQLVANTLVWKERARRGQAEGAQLGMEEMRRAHRGEVARLESEIQALERAARERPEAALAPAPAPGRLPSALRWLLPGLHAPGPRCPGPPLCQDACWRLLAAMPGTVALRCSARDYAVTEATKEACRIWGSGTMLGRSAVALARAQSSAWLQEAFDSHQGVVEQEKAMAGFPGFVVQDLGCEAFTSRKGETLDFSIMAMSFPAETTHGGQAEVVIVLSMERGAAFAPAWLGLTSRTLLPEQSEELPMSEVSMGAVGPDDSASNVCF